MKKNQIIAGIVIVLILVGAIAIWRMLNPVGNIGAAAGENQRVKGPEEAPVQIIEYSDFECPACKKGDEVIKQLQRSFPEKIRVHFKHYPLPGHRMSRPAHEAAECAARQNQFWAYHDLLFENQSEWPKSSRITETLLLYASNADLDLDVFASCLAKQDGARVIDLNSNEGKELQVRSTPTYFVNGERVVGGAELLRKVETLLGKVGGALTITRKAEAS